MLKEFIKYKNEDRPGIGITRKDVQHLGCKSSK
jgi:hypothetical protein